MAARSVGEPSNYSENWLTPASVDLIESRAATEREKKRGSAFSVSSTGKRHSSDGFYVTKSTSPRRSDRIGRGGGGCRRRRRRRELVY